MGHTRTQAEKAHRTRAAVTLEAARQTLTAVAGAPAEFDPPAANIRGLYESLHGLYGEQAWWPAQSPFEVVVGAVLTQNAAWANVEKAIERMRVRRLLSLDAVLASDHASLADAIRPSGYYNVKATRLRNLCELIAERGGMRGLAQDPLARQRRG